MDETPKFWWQSRTVWGGLVAIAAGIAPLFGIAFTAIDQDTLIELLVNGASVIGGILAIIGRFGAKNPIAGKGHLSGKDGA